MSDLSEFLLARIAEDEEDARLSEKALHEPGRAWWFNGDGWSTDSCLTTTRVLADCEAKRAIVERHPAVFPHDPYCVEDGEEPPCPTLRLLALPYADHPDFREEWRP